MSEYPRLSWEPHIAEWGINFQQNLERAVRRRVAHEIAVREVLTGRLLAAHPWFWFACIATHPEWWAAVRRRVGKAS